MDKAKHDADQRLAGQIQATLANCHRDKKTKASPYKPDDFRLAHFSEDKTAYGFPISLKQLSTAGKNYVQRHGTRNRGRAGVHPSSK